MNNIIKDIYYGNIFPDEGKQPQTPEACEKAKQILLIHNEILEAFPDAEELLERYRAAHYDSAAYFGYQQFQLGIRLGAQLMLELMAPIISQK